MVKMCKLTQRFALSIAAVCLGTLIQINNQPCEATEDHEHAQALKDFVPDHPHLHDLVDKTHEGDLYAKHKYERESLSVRCK